MEPIRVLIADDHTLFRTGLQALLSLYSDIQVIGEASSGKSYYHSRWRSNQILS
jgi:DNA-binding NarL/FixJ family response regulator